MKSLILALALFTGNAFACSCAEWGTPAEILATTDNVFVGSFHHSVTGEINPDSGEPLRVNTFIVGKSFKPRFFRGNRIVVRSEKSDGSNCGTEFARGDKYLILAYKHEGKLYTDMCSYREVENTREMKALLLALQAASH